MSNLWWQKLQRAINEAERCAMCHVALFRDEIPSGRCSQCEEKLTECCPVCNGKGRLEIIVGARDDEGSFNG